MIRIASCSFSGNEKITSIVIGDNVKTIDEESFTACKNLAKVILPEHLKEISLSPIFYGTPWYDNLKG